LKKVREVALRWALANAVEHEGRAYPKAVMGKLIAELPKQRAKVKELKAIVEKVVKEVNRLSDTEQRARLQKLGPPKTIRTKEKRGLPELPNVDKYPGVVTRFAPNPNGPLHIGHIRAALLSCEYARRYKGKFILRFEDTNPANAMLEMYDLIKLDLNWLGIKWDEEHLQSDRLDVYYKYVEQLLAAGKAYVCICKVMDFRKLRDQKKPCPCRGLPADEQLKRWRAMLKGEYGKERAVVRVKTDLKHPNPAVRDWPALRVVSIPHPRVGDRYRVWPLYNFSVSIDDHEMGVTHVIRGKEHVVNEMRQRTLFEHLGWDYPTAVQYGRLKIGGTVLSKTQTMRGIQTGEFSGYDDPRLGTIAALRRRGFLSEAIRQVILDVGPTPVDAALSWETLAAHNRKFVDVRANRYFFVPNPVKLMVRKVPELREANLRLHPSDPKRGKRAVPLSRKGDVLTVHLPKGDVSSMRKGQIFRLKDLMNVKLSSLSPLEADFQSFEVADVSKIQWVSAKAVEVEIIKPDNSRERGLAEPAVAELKAGEIVQFERYGFVRIDSVKPKLVVVYGHR
jgi:glutamyl-tRNA synthetase